jgi:multiple sugar transport system substrate-binding protein
VEEKLMRNPRWFVALVAAILVVSACSNGGGASASAGNSGAGNGKPASLTIAAVKGVEDGGLKAVAPMYEQKTGIKLNFVELPYSDLYDKLVTTFKANDATYDLVMLDDPWMPKFGTDGSLQDLGKFGISRDSDIASVIYDVGTWPPPRGAVPPSEKGKTAALLGVTVVGNVEMFMYRSDLVSTPPKTWDDVLKNATEQKKDNVAGYIIRGKATNPVVADFLPILWSFGGDVFDENWNVVIDNDKSMAAVDFLTNKLKAVAQQGPAETDASERSTAMALGKGFESTVWPGEVNSQVLDPGTTTVAGKVAFIPMPAGPSGKGVGMMGNWLLGIPKAAKNAQASADFIKWMTEKDTQQKYAEAGGIPSRTSILTDSTLNQKNPYFKALADSLAAGPNWRPRTDQCNAVETALGTHLNAILAGTENEQDGIKKAAGEIRKIMKDAGYPTQ